MTKDPGVVGSSLAAPAARRWDRRTRCHRTADGTMPIRRGRRTSGIAAVVVAPAIDRLAADADVAATP